VKNGLKEFFEYIKENLPLVIKGFGSAILLILGPLVGVLIRFSQGNWFLILVVGLIFEIFGILIFWIIIREDYFKITEKNSDKE
jgi:hypothetical protein